MQLKPAKWEKKAPAPAPAPKQAEVNEDEDDDDDELWWEDDEDDEEEGAGGESGADDGGEAARAQAAFEAMMKKKQQQMAAAADAIAQAKQKRAAAAGFSSSPFGGGATERTPADSDVEAFEQRRAEEVARKAEEVKTAWGSRFEAAAPADGSGALWLLAAGCWLLLCMPVLARLNLVLRWAIRLAGCARSRPSRHGCGAADGHRRLPVARRWRWAAQASHVGQDEEAWPRPDAEAETQSRAGH